MQKKNLTILLCIVILLVLFFGIRSMKHPAPFGTPSPVDTTVPSAVATEVCGFKLIAPIPNVSVTFPIAVTAVVDNSHASDIGCSWSTFEANAGPVKVVNAANAQVGFGILETTSNWMTTGPVTYYATVNQTASVTSGEPLTIMFTENDPSDGEAGPISTLAIPVTAQ